MMKTAMIMTEQDYKQKILEMIEAFERDGQLGYIYSLLLEAEAEVKSDLAYDLTLEQVSSVEEEIAAYNQGSIPRKEEAEKLQLEMDRMILEGEADIEDGNVISHEELGKRMKDWRDEI